jgi:hypothetical protein
MWLIRPALAVLAWLISSGAFGQSSSLQLSGNSYWLVIASRQSLNEAIGVARNYMYSDKAVKVIRSENGWYAIVAGPEKTGDPQQYIQKLKSAPYPQYPKDIRLSRGEKFAEQVWAPIRVTPLASSSYDGEKPVSLTYQDIEVKLSSDKASTESDSSDSRVATATGLRAGDQIFAMRMPDDHPASTPASKVDIVKLDRDSARPQIVFTYFWGGAHCCTITRIASMDYGGSWRVIHGQILDGDDGYFFEDIDGDGTAELINRDNAFLYAFSSYAESFTPLQITRVVNGKLQVVTQEPQFRDFLKQEVARIEHAASLDSSLWSSNGFLGAWVAAKALVGEGEVAWTKMLASYNRNSDWSNEECLADLTIDKCPQNQIRKLSFPEALKKLLVQQGYRVDFDKVSVPTVQKPARSAGWGNTPLLQLCADSLPTVQSIVAGILTGAKDPPQAWVTTVTVEDNATLDDSDEKLNRVTCSVSYKADLPRLIGLLAQSDRMASANKLSALRRRAGSTLSHRVKFTVQPTSKPGTTWIQVLP